ncbi:MAG: type IV pilus secretin PilQ, partial [Gammaproteobacteria bacterium]|nr:type IV pilus secretin PilQ [Gammaproteobacteria bacterium]
SAATGGSKDGIGNVDFRRGEDGQGRVIITLSDPSIPVDLQQQGGKVIVDFYRASLPKELERRLDVLDFATPVKTIDTFTKGENIRMVITPMGEYEYLAYQSGNQFTIEVRELTKEEVEDKKKDEFGYSGERLSLNFQDIEVRSVLQLIADFTGINIVVSDTVGGSLTLRLKNVPWDQALDIILKTKGLAMRQSGNVMLVAPSEEIAAREKLELESQKQIEELERRLDVLDFATPVKTIDTFTKGENVHMVITPMGEYEYLAYQSGNQFTIEVRELTKEEVEESKKDELGYSGERLSLNFQGIEVGSVLQLIADFTGINIVVSDTVGGSLTLRLKNVPWDQALDIILKTKGLAMRQNGNVMLVAPSEEIAAREKLELESQKQIEELEPLYSEFIQVNYAKAEDIAELLKSADTTLLSDRGMATIDERTNTLLVQDIASKLVEVRKLVARLDIPVRQVLIEARIVVAKNDFAKDLGVKFGLSKRTRFNDDHVLVVGGAQQGGVVTDPVTGFEVPSGSGSDGLLVDLPVIGATSSIGLAVGKLGSHLLQLELSAMEAEGTGEVISSPRVLTSNQKAAFIESGVEIPYQEATSSGATNVSFKKAVLSLNVVPQITPDDRIIMDLQVNKDSVGEVFLGVPSIDTNEVSTQVLVDNGETLVLGGIYEQTRSDEIDRVPFFGELPLVDWMFKQTRTVDDKAELLIFVTPKIVKENINI